MKIKKIAALIAVAGLSGSAFATNGYFSHGYGIKAKSIGGAGIALPQDAMAAATNPAGMVSVGSRIDFGADLFMPDRTAEWTKTNAGAGFNVPIGSYTSGKKQFIVPEFGYNRMIGKDMSLGVVVYGNGGMNTTYDRAVLAGGTTNTHSNLEQLFISPTLSMRLTPEHSVGVSLNLVRQTFVANGLEGFAAYTSDMGGLTNRGEDVSGGAGVKVGWAGQIASSVTLGAVYQSRTRMSRFSKYNGLFAENGDFDIPENYGIGVAFKPNATLAIAADIVEIKYGDIKSLANDGSVHPVMSGIKLGASNGAGFGWSDQTVYKLGMLYQYNDSLLLRAGYNYAKMPLNQRNTYFNILAPATVESHLTLGATWTMADKSELTVSYMHAFNRSLSGTGGDGTTGAFGGAAGYPVNLKMDQKAIGVAYGWKM